MKKIILFLALLAISCSPEYDGETKLVVKGKVIDRNNQPISNKSVKVLVSQDNPPSMQFLAFGYGNLMAQTTTDENGNYTLVFPSPTSNFRHIIVEVNQGYSSWIGKQFINIQPYNFSNYQLDLPVAKLYDTNDLCYLNIIPNASGPNTQLLSVDIIGELPNEVVAINPIPIDIDFPEPNFYSRNVIKNQTLTINYVVKDLMTNVTSNLQQSIVIDNSPEINFTLNY